MTEEKGKRFNRRGGLFFPLLLIVIGLILVLRTLGIFEGDLLDAFLRLWPLLLILMGLDGIYKREGVVVGVLIACVGLIFLLVNFGYLALDIWQMVFTLWPLVLIAIGFDIFVARRSLWMSLIGVVVILIVLAGSLWYFGVVMNEQNIQEGQNISQAVNGARRAEINLEPGVGTLKVKELRDGDELVAGVVSTGGTFPVEETYVRQNDAVTYTLKTAGNMKYEPAFGGEVWTWDLGLTPDIPLSLYTHLGVGSSELDMSKLYISDLRTGLGVGGMYIILPEQGGFQAKISGAIGKVDIYVPIGLELRISSELGLANLKIPPGYINRGGLYTSPGYEGSDNRADLDLDLSIGLITIQNIEQ